MPAQRRGKGEAVDCLAPRGGGGWCKRMSRLSPIRMNCWRGQQSAPRAAFSRLLACAARQSRRRAAWVRVGMPCPSPKSSLESSPKSSLPGFHVLDSDPSPELSRRERASEFLALCAEGPWHARPNVKGQKK